MNQTHPLVGCTGLEYIDHIADMNCWGGTRVIDHVRPISSFNLLEPGEAQTAFNWRNTQVLTAEENMEKSDRYTLADEERWLERMIDLGYEGELFPMFIGKI